MAELSHREEQRIGIVQEAHLHAVELHVRGAPSELELAETFEIAQPVAKAGALELGFPKEIQID